MLQFLARAGASMMSAGRAAGSRLAKMGASGRAAGRVSRAGATKAVSGDDILSRALGATVEPQATHKESRMQRVLNMGWALDSWSNRFGSMYPRFSETIQITVHGRRTSHNEDLYVLALGLLTAVWRFGSQSIFNEAIKVTIDRTGKTVQLEFNAGFQGVLALAGAFGSAFGTNTPTPYLFFHDRGWLNDDVTLPGNAATPTDAASAEKRWKAMPSVLRLNDKPMDSTNTLQQADEAGNYGAWRVTTNPQGTSPPFVTYAPANGPAPADGTLADDSWPALVKAALLDPCRKRDSGDF